MRLVIATVALAVLAALGLIVLKRVDRGAGDDPGSRTDRGVPGAAPSLLSDTVERPTGYRACAVPARLRGEAEVAVRNGPGARQPVLATVDAAAAPELTIVGGQGGWFLVQLAPGARGETAPGFAGRGWVEGARLRVAPAGMIGHARADAQSPAADDLARYRAARDGVALACQDRWVLIEHRAAGARARRGWFRACPAGDTLCSAPAR